MVISAFVGDYLVAALADGAGSAAHSEIGAEMACRAALEFLKPKLDPKLSPNSNETGWKGLLAEAAKTARLAVLKEAEQAKRSPRDYASTLILIIASRSFATAFQIGDGAALALDGLGQLTCLTAPAESEYLNETIFLTAEQGIETARFGFFTGNLKGLAAFTDGLQMLALKMPGATPHLPFFTPLFKFLEQEIVAASAHEKLKSFLASPRITQRADDDLTLFLALFTDRPNETGG